MPSPLDRRTFLTLLAAGTVSGALVPGMTGSVWEPAGATTPTASAASKGGDGVVQLGRLYLRDHPDERNASTLRSLLPGLDATQPVRPQLPALAPAAVSDFGAGRVVDVDGWHLALTEARASAAVALEA